MSARLIGHAGGIDLGPADPHEWLCGFVYRVPSGDQRKQLRPLARRIEGLEPRAVALLRPDDAGEDWPEDIRHRDGIVLHQLGRHSGAARWAIRGAVVRGWQRHRDLLSRSAQKQIAEANQRAARALLGNLRSTPPRSRMALQRAGLSGGSAALPARPDLDGKGTLVEALASLEAAATADLARLAALGGPGRWPDWTAGDAEGIRVTMAHEAVPVWLHFRPQQRPTGGEGQFAEFAAVLHEVATGDGGRDMKRDVRAALDYYAQAIQQQCGLARLRGALGPDLPTA